MAPIALGTGYRIGPPPARPVPTRPALPRWLAPSGAAAAALLTGLVLVINQGVARGDEIRAEMARPVLSKPARLALACRSANPPSAGRSCKARVRAGSPSG